MHRCSLFFTVFVFGIALAAQPVKKITTEEYIEQYKGIAINEMHRTGIPASIKLAQGILESGSGNSRLAKEANNHFGIKCHKGWTGQAVYEDDDAPNECFRQYTDPTTSYLDHSEFLMTRNRYAFLFQYDKTDYKRWAHGLKKAGYATNPKYAPLLIGLIERYNLHQYDLAGPVNEPIAIAEELEEYPGEEIAIYPAGIIEINRANAVYLQHGQTVTSLSETYNLPERKVKKWNDLDLGYQVEPGMYLFLQPKRNRGAIKYHRVAEGETMYAISQRYGVKVDKLYKRNLMDLAQQPAAGQRLYLRGKRDNPPKLRPKVVIKPKSKKPVAQSKTPDTPKVEEATAAVVTTPEQSKAEEPKEPAKYTYKPEVTGQEDPYAAAQKPSLEDELSVKKPVTIPQAGKDEAEVPTVTTGSGHLADTTASPEATVHVVNEGETLYALSKKYEVTVAQLSEWNDLKDNHIQIGQALIISQPE